MGLQAFDHSNVKSTYEINMTGDKRKELLRILKRQTFVACGQDND